MLEKRFEIKREKQKLNRVNHGINQRINQGDKSGSKSGKSS